jgi:hypothetical protein
MPPDEFSAIGDRPQAIATLERLLAGLDQPPGDDADRATELRRLLSALETVRLLRDDLTRWEPRLIGAARELGVSWAEIAPALGVASRQAAERRYLRLNPDASAPHLTGEQRVQAARDRRAGDRAVAGWARTNSGALRRLAGQVAGLNGLDPDSQASADKVQEALGLDDSTALLGPLAEVRNRLADSHPALATQLNQVTADTDQVRLMTHRTDAGRHTGAAGEPEKDS